MHSDTINFIVFRARIFPDSKYCKIVLVFSSLDEVMRASLHPAMCGGVVLDAYPENLLFQVSDNLDMFFKSTEVDIEFMHRLKKPTH